MRRREAQGRAGALNAPLSRGAAACAALALLVLAAFAMVPAPASASETDCLSYLPLEKVTAKVAHELGKR
jgi:hypothetical protein